MWKTRVQKLGLFLAAAFLCANLAVAQTVKKETADFLMTGVITAIDTTAKTITLKGANGESGTFVVNDATTIMDGNAKIALSGLQKGARVALNGDNPGDKKIATYIEVVEGPDKK
jgi:Cu/Ag efflux protein CusF